MKHVAYGFEVIVTENALTSYIERIEQEEESLVEMRYLADTAINGEQSFVARICEKHIQAQLFIPHFWTIPHLPKRIIRKDQELHEILRKGLQKKAHLELKKWKLIQTIPVKNTNGLVEKEIHNKHLVDIFSYDKFEWFHRNYESFARNMTPIWIHDKLIDSIFEKVGIRAGQAKFHTQYEIFHILNKKHH